MKLWNSIGPNPHVVRMFIAEKGIDLAREDINLMTGENRRAPFLAKNAAGQSPALELANGTTVCEILPICEYLEELHPAPALIGATPEERAETRMWARRIDLGIVEPMANGFRASEGRPLFEGRMMLVGAEGAADLKALAADKLMWLDAQMTGREWICGPRFSLADVLLYPFLKFGATVGQPLPTGARWLPEWFERVDARPAARA